MRPDNWYLTEDVDDFLAHAGDFLRSRPGPHVMQLTWAERVQARGAEAFGTDAPVFGVLEQAGEVRGTFFRLPPRGIGLSPRYADKRYTLWETADGTAVSIAGMNPLIGGQIQVDIVYTPAHLRGRGYAAAVTAEVSRAALAAGARDVVLFADLSNPTSNALYQRLGYRALADWAVYDFSHVPPEAS